MAKSNQELLDKLAEIKSRKESTKPTVTVVKTTKKDHVKKDIQSKVDEHIQLHAEYKELEKRLKQLRDEIEPYMDEKDIMELSGTDGGKIMRVEQSRPEVTSRYTKYDINIIEPQLPATARKKCVVKVIDADALKALGTLGEIDQSIIAMATKKTIISFTVKH
jgi:chromosome segregation ATPase